MISALIGPVTALLDKVIPDAGERARLAHEIATMAERQAHEIALAQIEVNKEEAKSDNVFKSGWRPFIGWVCGAAFAYHFVGQPVIMFVLAYFGLPAPELPEFDMMSLMTVLGGLLGLGGLRTFEKYKGVTK
jgi:Holin of 3TMs, for gene-transfer release